MNIQHFKLVPATAAECFGEPHILVGEGSGAKAVNLQATVTRPDFVLNLVRGSIGVFNLSRALAKKTSIDIG